MERCAGSTCGGHGNPSETIPTQALGRAHPLPEVRRQLKHNVPLGAALLFFGAQLGEEGLWRGGGRRQSGEKQLCNEDTKSSLAWCSDALDAVTASARAFGLTFDHINLHLPVAVRHVCKLRQILATAPHAHTSRCTHSHTHTPTSTSVCVPSGNFCSSIHLRMLVNVRRLSYASCAVSHKEHQHTGPTGCRYTYPTQQRCGKLSWASLPHVTRPVERNTPAVVVQSCTPRSVPALSPSTSTLNISFRPQDVHAPSDTRLRRLLRHALQVKSHAEQLAHL